VCVQTSRPSRDRCFDVSFFSRHHERSDITFRRATLLFVYNGSYYDADWYWSFKKHVTNRLRRYRTSLEKDEMKKKKLYPRSFVIVRPNPPSRSDRAYCSRAYIIHNNVARVSLLNVARPARRRVRRLDRIQRRINGVERRGVFRINRIEKNKTNIYRLRDV